jgi:trimeric autotransporter adhesin
MSTKTTFKRIALVTVAALGFGGLSATTPASAVAVSSFSLHTSSITVVGGSASDTPSALVRIRVTQSGDGALNVGALDPNETITASVTGVPTSVTAKTVALNGGAFGTATNNDLSIVEVKAGASNTVTDWAYNAAGDGRSGVAATSADTVTATAAIYDGRIGSENTSYFGQVPYTLNGGDLAAATTAGQDTVTSKSRFYYVAIMPKSGAAVIDQGVYTVTFRLTDTNGNLVSTQSLNIDFVSNKVDSGSKLALTTGGTFVVGSAVAPTGVDATSNDVFARATLTNRDGGVIRGTDGGAESLTTTLRRALATSDTLTVTSSDNGTEGQDWGTNDTDDSLVGNDGVYGISIPAIGTDGTYTLTARHGSAVATATLTVFAASITASSGLSAAVTATGAIATASTLTPYTVPLTTKTADVTVTVLTASGGTAVQDYPVTFTTTWTSCAAGDATPRTGTLGSTVVRTNSSGKATLTVTCASPADGTKASVAWVAGATAGTTQVIDWVMSKPATVSVDPTGPMTVALKAVTKATFTVRDAFGAPVAGTVVNLTVTGSNNTTASPLLIPSATTDANGQVSYTLTDALAIAAGTDVIRATTVDGAKTAALTLTYAATAPVPASMKVYYDALEATWTTLVPATTIFETPSTATGYTLNQGKLISRTLVPGSRSASDDVIGFNANVATAALAAASGVPVTVSVSAGGWILSSAGLPVTSRTFYTSSTGFTGLIEVTATTPGVKTLTFTSGAVTSTASIAFTNGTNGAVGRYVTVTPAAKNATATANGNIYPAFTAKVTDALGNAVSGVQLNIVATGVGRLTTGGKTAQWTTDATGEYTFELSSTEAGAAAVSVSATTVGQFSDIAGFAAGAAVNNTALTAGVRTATGSVTFAEGSSAATETAQAAADAAAEATDAANAATDAANAAAEAADAATAAAQDAADAVAALSTSVSAMISDLKRQITALTNLVIKIQRKVRA